MSLQPIIDHNHTTDLIKIAIPRYLPKKLHNLYQFGIKAFTLNPLESCNANSRIAHPGKREAAQQMMYRLLSHPKLHLLVWRVVAKERPLKNTDLVNVDYSNLNPLAILGFAKQTKHGRAEPVLMRSLASNTQGYKKTHPKYDKLRANYQKWKDWAKADQYSFVTKSLKLLQYLYNVKPRLVFDRGFVNERIIQFMVDASWVFYIRMREDFKVYYRRKTVRVSELPKGSHTVYFAGRKLRLVVTKTRARYKHPWYILTNDTETKPNKIAKIYYRRFQIEEYFRDLKSVFKCKYMRLRKWQSLSVLLCFMSLGIILALTDKQAIEEWETQKSKLPEHKHLSIIRIWQEALHRRLIHTGMGEVLGVAG